MCAALVGDFQWLMASREEIERGNGCRLTCLDGKEGDLNESVSASDIVVMLTDQVPHAVRRRVLCVASVNNVPVYMRHSSGATTIRACLKEFAVS